MIKWAELTQPILANIPFKTVPVPICILINPAQFVVYEFVSEYTDEPLKVPDKMDIFKLNALLEEISPVVFLRMDWKLILVGD